MTTVEIIAQILSIFGMVFSILSFQQKKQSVLLTFIICGCVFFTTSFLLLGAYVGAILNAIGIFRAVAFLNKEKFKADHIAWLIGYIVVFIIIYVLTFTVFGIEPKPINFIIEILPIVGMTTQHISYRKNNTKSTRKYGLICSPSWLIYNIYYMSIGAIIGETLNICSIVVGILRHDLKKKVKSE